MESILVVEDSVDVLKNILQLLQIKGYSAIGAKNGVMGLKLAREHLPDLIISDIMMPELDGYDFLQEIRNDPYTSNIPFVFLTAKADRNAMRKGMVSGADDYVGKPFKAKELFETIETRLDRKHKQDSFLNEIYQNISKYIPHELRTPLVSIMGFTDMMIDDIDCKREERIEMLKSIKQSSKRLYTTLEKFMMYAEIETLCKDTKNMRNYLEQVTDSAELVIRMTIEERAARDNFQNRFDIDLQDASIKMSTEHFKILINELIENAIKFSKEGSKIDVFSQVEDSFYKIRVKNTGRGMSTEQIAKISPFIQHERNLYEQNGNGLGLATVKKIVELYETQMNIDSEPGQYTSVEIKIPFDYII